MIQQFDWTIEQHDWDPELESQVEKQMSFSNGYLCQTAHMEEYYSGEQQPQTYIHGIEMPIPHVSAVSIRLHDERLDLHTWQVHDFVRVLHRNEPLLERSFSALSPKGHHLRVRVQRRLFTRPAHALEIRYRVSSVNYNGPISILPLIGEVDATDWYPLMNSVDEKCCWMWLQMNKSDLQLCCAMKYSLFKNGEQIAQHPIKIEKQRIIGYSHTLPMQIGDTFELIKTVVIMDSSTHDKEHLPQDAAECLTRL